MKLSNWPFYVGITVLALVGPVLLVLKLHTDLLVRPLGYLGGRLETPQRIVTVDLVELTSSFTLDLAAGDLSDDDVKATSRAWAERLQDQLQAVARDNNLIIVPKGVGVYGAVFGGDADIVSCSVA